MSFVDESDILKATEEMLTHVFKTVIDVELPNPIPRMTYAEAMARFGSDKPDLRFGYEIHSINDIAGKTDFKVFQSVIETSGAVAGICVPDNGFFSRKQIDILTKEAQKYGAKGLAYVKVTEDGLDKGIAKFLTNVEKELIEEFNAKAGDILFFVADSMKNTYPVLGSVRLIVARTLNLIPQNIFKPVWITEI